MIIILSKRTKIETIRKKYPMARVVDVTSSAEDRRWTKLSPFYPHGGIPIPNSDGFSSMSVEGVWQGLKVFENEGIDMNSFGNGTMKNIKRTQRKHGRTMGHQYGLLGRGEPLLDYVTARKKIYIPTYRWMLEHKAMDLVEELREVSEKETVILLDYDTNGDVEMVGKPLSHASLIKAYIEGLYPYGDKKVEEKVEEDSQQTMNFE